MAALVVGDQFRALTAGEVALLTGVGVIGPGLPPAGGPATSRPATYALLRQCAKQTMPANQCDENVTMCYLELICHHHNALRPAPPATLPNYIYFENLFVPSLNPGGTPHIRVGIHNGTFQLNRMFGPLTPTGVPTKALRSAQLLAVEHIFLEVGRSFNNIPYGPGGAAFPGNRADHGALLVISPRNRTMEYFDSWNINAPATLGGLPAPQGLDGGLFFYVAITWLRFELKDRFILEEWSFRQGECPIQGNAGGTGLSCGVHCCINAFNVAFGFHNPAGAGPLFNFGDVLRKRLMIPVELINNRFDLGVNAAGVPVAGPPMTNDDYQGRTLNAAGVWVDQTPAQYGPHLNSFTRLTREQLCSWHEQHGLNYTPGALPVLSHTFTVRRGVRIGGRNTTTRSGNLYNTSAANIIPDVSVVTDLGLLKDILDDLRIPGRNQMLSRAGPSTRLLGNWTLDMVRIRICQYYDEVPVTGRFATMWAALPFP